VSKIVSIGIGLSNRVTVIGRISASEVMFELAFNITKQRGGAKPEQIGAQPAVAQFFFDQSQIGDGVLGL
jgi:hypothetical protein